MEDNDEEGERPLPSSTWKKSVIKIPPLQGTSSLGASDDGVGGTSTSTSASHPKAASFSQAFSFVKNSEFYSLPPPAASQAADCARGHSASAQSENVPVGGTPSCSNASSSSSPANFVAGSRSAIRVSHRQSFSRLMDASMEELARCPGIGKASIRHIPRTIPARFLPIYHPVQEKVPGESSSVVEAAEIVERKANPSEAGKEPGVTVESALSTAFAKYSNKIRKQERRNRSVAQGEGTSGASSEQQEDAE